MSENRYKQLNAFFYVKGSTDFPTGHLISERFGYQIVDNQITETPIFSYSVKDLFTKLSNPKVVENLYSLDLPIEYKTPEPHFSTKPEYISSLVINAGDDKAYKNINPNYLGNMTDINPVTNLSYRENEFWQKMMTIFEFLKYNEYSISVSAPLVSGSAGYDEADYSSSSKTIINSEPTLVGKLLTLFLANPGRITPATGKSVDDVREFREYFIRERGSNESVITNTRAANWGLLDIDYIPKTTSVNISKLTGRVDSISFTVTYNDDIAIQTNTPMQWNFVLYFTPDGIIDSLGGSRFKVHTYNDRDFDGQYSNTEDGFNYLDNDYANTLSQDYAKKGKFILSTIEMKNQMMQKIVEIMRDGQYSNFVEFNTRRIIPFIADDTGGKKVVMWSKDDDSTYNEVTQTFFVFYSSSIPPSAIDQQDAVKSYLRAEHAKCGPQVIDKEGNVRYIGHGPTSEDINNFLSKMYPDLFSLTSLIIVPTLHTRYTGYGIDNSNAFIPESYIHPLTLSDLYNTITTVPELSSTKFDERGIVSSDGIHHSIEIFYIGGSLSDNNIKFNFPFACIQKDSNELYPLTSITGFNNYKQKIFNGDDTPSAAYDIFQFIIIQLFIKAFQKTSNDNLNKPRLSTICGVPIDYSYNYQYDESLSGLGVVNVAEFTILGISFVIYSQPGKNFGSATRIEE